MRGQEINKIIAEFMGVGCDEQYEGGCNWNTGAKDTCESCVQAVFKNLDYFIYTKSLDALVPVWEKLNRSDWMFYKSKNIFVFEDIDELDMGKNTGKTLQQAAAHATAQAILKLKESQNE